MEHAEKTARELQQKTYGLLTKAIVHAALDQKQALNADGHLSVGVMKPETLTYALFARFSKKAIEQVEQNEPGAESHAESMLDLLKKIAELIRLSQEDFMNMNKEHTDEYMATTLVKKAVIQAHDALAQVYNSAFGPEADIGSKRKRSNVHGEADMGMVVEAIAPLTRMVVWLLRRPNEYEENVAEDLDRIAVNLDMGVSHMARLIEVDKLLADACREHVRKAENTGAFKRLKERIAMHEQSLSAAQQKLDNLCEKTVLFVTDSYGKIKQWNHGAEFLTTFEKEGALGMNVIDLCVSSDQIAALVLGLAADTTTEVKVTMRTKHEPVSVRLNVCCTCEQDYDVLWYGAVTDIMSYVHRIEDLENDQARSSSVILEKEKELSEKAQELSEKAQEIAEKAQEIAEKAHKIEAQEQELAGKAQKIEVQEQELAEKAQKIEDLVNALTKSSKNLVKTQKELAEKTQNVEAFMTAQAKSSKNMVKKQKELAEKTQNVEDLMTAQAKSSLELAEKEKELVLVLQKLKYFNEWAEKDQELSAREREISIQRQKLKDFMPDNM